MGERRDAGMSGRLPLVERDGLLATLTRVVNESRSGRGCLVLISGEAGVGKTTLINALVADLPTDIILRRGGSDNVTPAAPLGPFLEAVPELGDFAVPVAGEDSSALFRTARDVLSASPACVVLEDVHWADGASLDLLRHLGRRIDGLGSVVLATYRSDELDIDHPLRIVLGDLATSPAVLRVEVPPLSVDGVRLLAESAGSHLDVTGLHSRTGGNAFYVSEVLAASADDLPPTVKDAVLARVARLGSGARRVLTAAAVLGPGTDASLVAEVAERTVADVDEAVARGVLLSDGRCVSFRHDLASRAIEEASTFADRAELHVAALAALRRRGSADDRRLAHHAAAGGDRAALREHGFRAGVDAATRGAHREAAEHFRVVVDVVPADAPERADVLDRLATELCLVGRAEEALAVEHEALQLHQAAGSALGTGRAFRWISRLSWMLGRGAASEQFAHRAVETLEPHGAGHELGMAYSNLAQIHMLSDAGKDAQLWGGRALAIADDLDDPFVRAHALNNVGSAIATADQLDEGVAMLRESLDIALRHGYVDHAARAYCNLSVSFLVHRRFIAAEQILDEGRAYCGDRDLDYYGDYMWAMLATSMAERGAFTEALDHARYALAAPHMAVVGRIPALTVMALVEVLRTGRRTDEDMLEEARWLAVETREPQRLVPVALAAAQVAWIEDRQDVLVEVLDGLWADDPIQHDVWRLGEIVWWSAVAGRRREPARPPAEPFRLMLEGQMGEAARLWNELGSPLWAARALAMSRDADEARQGFLLLDKLEAAGVKEAIMRDRQRLDLPTVRGPQRTSVAHPAGLTRREDEVLQLMADGLTNSQIGDALYVSVKTAGHHVSAVLRKLEAPNRARAVAMATERGLLDDQSDRSAKAE